MSNGTNAAPPGIAPLTNVARLQTLIQRCIDRPDGVHGMATFYGPSNDGKSFACMNARHVFGAVYVQMKSVWAKKDLCEAILKEMGIPPRGRIASMAEEIAGNLLETDRVLIVDEADMAVGKKMVEILRDIYEMSRAPVILVGEEKLPQKLSASERIHNRMLDFTGTEPASSHDVTLLSRLYAPNIEIDPALLARLNSECHGSVGRIVRNITHIREFASMHGMQAIRSTDWADKDVKTLEAPQPRNGTMKRAGIA